MSTKKPRLAQFVVSQEDHVDRCRRDLRLFTQRMLTTLEGVQDLDGEWTIKTEVSPETDDLSDPMVRRLMTKTTFLIEVSYRVETVETPRESKS